MNFETEIAHLEVEKVSMDKEVKQTLGAQEL